MSAAQGRLYTAALVRAGLLSESLGAKSADAAKGRVLFVDDDPGVRTAFVKSLRRFHFDIDVASGGEEAIALANHHDYSVIATDLRMPGMGGVELIARLRDVRPDAAVLVVTASPEEGPSDVAPISSSVIEIVEKPWDTPELAAAIKRGQQLHASRRASLAPSTPEALHFLILETSMDDADALHTMLRVAFDQRAITTKVSGLHEAMTAIVQRNPACIFSPADLGDGEGIASITRLLAASASPVIIVDDGHDGQLATKLLELGARDYLNRNELNTESLARAVRYALDRHRSHERYRKLMLSNPEAVVVVDRAGVILHANPAAGVLFSKRPEKMIGDVFEAPLNDNTGGEIILSSGKHTQLKVVDTDWQGNDALVVLLRDVTERRRVEYELAFLSHHDQLTGLANRALLSDRLSQALARAKRSRTPFAVLLLDLDRFQLVNDTVGHGTGDALLKEAAARLFGAVRASDTVARIGGDEFVVLAENCCDDDGARTLALKIIDRLTEPFVLSDQRFTISASVGIARSRYDDTSEALLKRADSAMYRAKHDGRKTFRFFDEDAHARMVRKLQLENALHGANVEQEFDLVYQPLVGRDRLIGAEALLRWQHPKEGPQMPGDFVPLLEETGLISLVESWSLMSACKTVRQWHDAGYEHLRASVNVSTRHLHAKGFLRKVLDTLDSTGLPPSKLELEITESLLIEDTAHATKTLGALSEHGVRIALDDFGTGYSSLSYLRQFPTIDTLKIDSSFVWEIGTAKGGSIVAAVIDLAHSLELEVVAEGVETPEQLQFLMDHGCDVFQGYLFARPLSSADWLQNTNSLGGGAHLSRARSE